MPRRVLTDDQAADAARRLAAGESYAALVADYGVSRSTLIRVRRRVAAGQAPYRTPLPARPPQRRGQPSTIRPGYAAHSPQLRELGARLRALRLARRLPVSYVAGTARVDRHFVADIEAGHRRPSPTVLRQLVATLGSDYDELARLAGYG